MTEKYKERRDRYKVKLQLCISYDQLSAKKKPKATKNPKNWFETQTHIKRKDISEKLETAK